MFNFERLDCWQHAVEYADVIYDLTAWFPVDERFGLTNQMRRAAVSVSANIAEGASRASNADYARFVEISTGSLFETVSEAFIARRRKFLSEADFAALYSAAERQGKMLSGLRNSLLKR